MHSHPPQSLLPCGPRARMMVSGLANWAQWGTPPSSSGGWSHSRPPQSLLACGPRARMVVSGLANWAQWGTPSSSSQGSGSVASAPHEGIRAGSPTDSVSESSELEESSRRAGGVLSPWPPGQCVGPDIQAIWAEGELAVHVGGVLSPWPPGQCAGLDRRAI